MYLKNMTNNRHQNISSILFILLCPLPIIIISSFTIFPIVLAIRYFGYLQWLSSSFYAATTRIISTGLMIFFIFLITRLKEKRSLSTLGLALNHNTIKEYLRGAAIGMLMFAVSIIFIIINSKGKVIFNGMTMESLIPFIVIILSWMIQGASEEIILRGYMLPALTLKKGIKFGVIVSSIYFAALHLFNNGITVLSFINIILVGIFTTFYALYEDGIWGVCGFHSAWNFAQGNLFGCAVSGGNLKDVSVWMTDLPPGNELVTGGNFGPEGSFFVTLVLGISIILMLILLKKCASQNTTDSKELI